ncbi:MAG: hypothetical protein A2X42_10675 [Candidatus Margulisbacteria bacterium GWF2_38_17]|nr:MAG: hypothetical protein A2X43_13320 [Candidatus Margulisbacteria bacterium GWD2_39_127]OGI04763.1 MAG: hypothetical protein A2X42_10675 [Candidatus Margulisbacteria bacterium GWF2_38_17]OGI05708.1 MAG: hypothetical protein A2X41_03260 [Candidatus Margulisbacteria bacterium GWE2_39_32]
MYCIYTITIIIFLMITPINADISPDAMGLPARYQAMGLSPVAYQGDINNLFYNPAGINHYSSCQALSVYSRLISEIDYRILGFSFPLWGSTLGFGINSISVGQVPYATSFDPVNGNPVLAQKDYSNNLYQVSISHSFGSVWDQGLPLTLGCSLKYFQQGILGVAPLSGSGIGIDLGMIYELRKNLALAFVLKNPYAKVSWQTGRKESLDRSLLAGFTSDWFNADMNVAGNVEYNLTNASYYLMGGAEYTYKDTFTFRAGYKDRPYASINNKPEKSGTLSFGAGIKIGDFNLDYAYVPYYLIPEDTSHYLSISFVPFQTKQEVFVINLPTDNQVVYDPFILIEGVANLNINNLTINNARVTVEDDVFVVPVMLNYGENKIIVDAGAKRGENHHYERKVLRLRQFNDIPDDYKGRIAFDVMYAYDIVQGNEQGNFFPQENIDRSSFTASVMKLKGQVTKVYFDKKRKEDHSFKQVSDLLDFDNRDWAGEYLTQAKKEDIIVGYPDMTLRQKSYISRAEAMTIIARVERLSDKKSRKKVVTDVNNEVVWVDRDNWSYPYVNTLKQAKFLDYIDNGKQFMIDYIFTPEEKEQFVAYVSEKSMSVSVSNNTEASDTSTINIPLINAPPVKGLMPINEVYAFLETPEGRNIYYSFLRESEFIKKPIKKFELIEMLSKTSLFQSFLTNIGISMLPQKK